MSSLRNENNTEDLVREMYRKAGLFIRNATSSVSTEKQNSMGFNGAVTNGDHGNYCRDTSHPTCKPTISVEKNNPAKNTIRHIFMDTNNKFVNLWLLHDMDVFCIILYYETVPVSFALLHKMDYDPIHVHTKPVLLDYIFTWPNYRNHGFASKLIRKIKVKNQITGYCSTEQSELLFKRAGYSVDQFGMIRFPSSSPDRCMFEKLFGDKLDKFNSKK